MSIIVFIIVLSILVIAHELGHFIMAKRCGVKVEIFSLGFGPRIAGKKVGDTEYRISAVPLGGYVKMAGESHADKLTGARFEFLSKSVGERFKIVIGGPLLNYILGFVMFSFVFIIGIPLAKNTNRIGSLINGYPAVKQGIKAGDEIIAVDGKRTGTWEELVEAIHKKTEGSLTVRVKRAEKTFNVDIVPKVQERFIFGGGKRIALIGIRPEQEVKRYNPLRAVQMGAQKVIKFSILTFRAIGWMISGKLSLREITGPVGIFMMTGEVASLGIVYLLDFIGLISISLAIFNILPIPVLDGGHILFFLIEKVKGSPLSVRTQERATQAGLFILLALMIFVFYSDFLKFGILDKLITLFKR